MTVYRDQEHTVDYFRIFFETTRTLLSSRAPREILKLLVKRSVQALGAKAGSLRLVNEETNRLELVASHLLSRRYLDKGPLHLDRSIPEVLDRKPVVIQNACDDPRVEYREAKRDEGINTILSVPIEARGTVIGVLRLYTGEPRAFSEEEIEFASALAEVGGLAVANAKIYEDEGAKLTALFDAVGVRMTEGPRRHKQRFRSFALHRATPARTIEEFRALREVTKEMLANLDTVSVQTLILDKIVELTGVKGGCLRFINETTGVLQLTASRGLSEEYLEKGPIHPERSIGDTLSGAPTLIEDARTDPRVEYPEAAVQEGVCSILSIPIIARERVIGVLRLYSAERRSYARDEVVFLSALAEIAGVAIMNTRLYEQTRYDRSFWETTARYLGQGQEAE